jgi:cobalt/nickel transport system permease protein
MVVAAHVPIMIIEGIVSALCVVFLKKVQPSMLPDYSKKG